ncbi:PEP-CTERM sorting domain-containing protein [Steroidobacter agaridevorans]|uniref:PEP-CTERM sorting domain-containing protein n=1 Tax=Steroidobacter agaridevorans TaxID=2695856 RepID=UPI001323B363|nr:PEP-CTERM sorting domain-containing protein [Steroidobacter agaridevorans]GFE89200.1 hypothetical protein GCM10011488_41540 [Steroidobacter agaridevorans]
MNRIFAFVLLAFGFASTSHAIPTSWSDSADFGGGEHIGWFQSHTYTHDLTEHGFRPMEDLITSFNLTLSLGNDSDDGEYVAVVLRDPEFDRFELSGEAYGGFSILGLLNEVGTLTVTVQSLWGDFFLFGSTLTAYGDRNVANVPEPGALGLLGIGLIGIALSRRRRKQAA